MSCGSLWLKKYNMTKTYGVAKGTWWWRENMVICLFNTFALKNFTFTQKMFPFSSKSFVFPWETLWEQTKLVMNKSGRKNHVNAFASQENVKSLIYFNK